MSDKQPVERTPDSHYIIVNGRKWRATNPNLPEETRQALVNDLMKARRDIAAAKRAGDEAAEAEARTRVHAAKVALGERGPKWWETNEENAPDKRDGADEPGR